MIENTEYIFKCNVSDSNGIIFYWTLDDNNVLNTSRRFQIDSYLYIKNIDRELDSGEFKCIATDYETKFSIESRPGSLAINWLEDNITVQGTDSVLKLYSSVSLECLAYGSKQLSIKWYRNGDRYV